MRRRILIYVDSVRRDLATMFVMGKLLQRRGYSIAYCSPDTTVAMLRLWKPHILVHTHPHMIRGYFERGYIGRDRGPMVAIFPQEGIHWSHELALDWYGGILDEASVDFVQGIYFWNTNDRDWAIRNGCLPQSRLFLTGNIRLDLARFDQTGRVTDGPKSIGIIGRFFRINRFDGTSILYKVLTKPRRNMEIDISQIQAQLKTLNCYADVISHVMEKTDFRVSYRPHHDESPNNDGYRALKKKYGERFEIDVSYSIYHWALRQDVIVSTTSSTIAEIHLAGTPVICIDRLSGADSYFNRYAENRSIFDAYDQRLVPIDHDALLDSLRTVDHQTKLSSDISGVENYLSSVCGWPFARSAIGTVVEQIDRTLSRGDLDGRVPAVAFSPSFAAEPLQIYRALFSHPGRRASTLDRYFSRWLHRPPAYIDQIADAIDAESSRDDEQIIRTRDSGSVQSFKKKLTGHRND